MKRIALLFIGCLIAIIASGQTYMPKGAVVGVNKASNITNETTIQKIITVNGYLWFIVAGDSIPVGTPTENLLDADDYFVKLLPDTVTKSASWTLALTDAHKVIHTTKATSILVTIPPNNSVAIPIGTTINFVQSAAGIIVFKEGAGVNLYSKKDSIATGGIWSWAALYKRGTNNWILYGDIID